MNGSAQGDFFLQFDHASGYAVIVEDDGRSCYAYLLNKDREIVGDVWLYNRASTPAAPEWGDPSMAPFMNPAEYALDSLVLPNEGDISVSWEIEGKIAALIFFGASVSGRVEESAKPGWSRFAKKDGPLAKVLR